ncbi:MAG: TolB family protein [Ignavibacteriaceae bacterium]
MKHFFAFLFIFSVTLLPQQITVEKVSPVTDYNDGAFYYPQFSPDNKALLFSSEIYMGLWLYDLNFRSLSQINNHTGSGYNPRFSPNSENIVFRVDGFIEKLKYSDLRSYSLIERTEKLIFPQSRFLSEPFYVGESEIAFIKEPEVLSYNNLSKEAATRVADFPIVFVENSDLIIQQNGLKKTLNPIGEGNYIWASLSSDNSKILFHLAGKGTFITDINGNVLHELGKAHAPQFSPDGNFVAFMLDIDNGQFVTESGIFVYSLATKQKTKLAGGTDLIGMYPRWSPDGKRITFNTADGLIYIIELKID